MESLEFCIGGGACLVYGLSGHHGYDDSKGNGNDKEQGDIDAPLQRKKQRPNYYEHTSNQHWKNMSNDSEHIQDIVVKDMAYPIAALCIYKGHIRYKEFFPKPASKVLYEKPSKGIQGHIQGNRHGYGRYNAKDNQEPQSKKLSQRLTGTNSLDKTSENYGNQNIEQCTKDRQGG